SWSSRVCPAKSASAMPQDLRNTTLRLQNCSAAADAFWAWTPQPPVTAMLDGLNILRARYARARPGPGRRQLNAAAQDGMSDERRCACPEGVERCLRYIKLDRRGVLLQCEMCRR